VALQEAPYEASDFTDIATKTRAEVDMAGNAPEPLPGFSAEDMARLEAQTGNPFVDLFRGNVVWGHPFTDATWSLLNALMAIAAFILAVIFSAHIIRERRNRRGAGAVWEADKTRDRRVAALNKAVAVAGLVTVAFVALTADPSKPMTWVNQWTPPAAALFVVQLVLLTLCEASKNRFEKNESDDLSEAVVTV
jgi:hypothetical protein